MLVWLSSSVSENGDKNGNARLMPATHIVRRKFAYQIHWRHACGKPYSSPLEIGAEKKNYVLVDGQTM